MTEFYEDLYTIFKELKLGKNNEALFAQEISGKLGIFIACNQKGAPVFLIKINEDPPYRPSRQLKYLTITYHIRCRIKTFTTETVADFISIECNENFPDLFNLFINSCHALLKTLSERFSTTETQDHLQHIIDLFMKLLIPSSRSITGLWGELLIIARSEQPAVLLKAWHNSKFEKFDFATQSASLEVKTTQFENRIHEFSLEQLSEHNHPQKKYIASVKLRKMVGGVGIIDLAKKISDQILNERQLIAKLWDMIASMLGGDFSDRLDISFDEVYSINSMMIFKSKDIPTPIVSDYKDVFDIRFKSNLSSIEHKALGKVNRVNKIFSSKTLN